MSTGPRRLGKYELQQRLGQGGMAEVWKALDIQLQRYVAIKILHADLQSDPDFMMRFAREARVVASLHHPNIVQIHDFQVPEPSASSENIAYMVMDYIEGETLALYIRETSCKGQVPPASEIVHLFAALASAIDYAHQHGMIHRDIKPANILLDARVSGSRPLSESPHSMGEPILTDFGIAKLMGATTGVMSGSWLGTPLYISSEQAEGSPGNERSDIYSLGVILYEICTGRRPFEGDSPTAIMMQHIKDTPPSPSLLNKNIPPALSMVMLRCLAKDPIERFPSASSMAAALAEALGVAIPENLNLPAYPAGVYDEPTRYQSRLLDPLPPNRPSTGTPSSPSLARGGATPYVASSANSEPVSATGGALSGTANAGQGAPVLHAASSSAGTPSALPTPSVSRTPSLASQATGNIVPASSIPPLSTPVLPDAPRRGRRGLFAILIAVLLIGVVGAGLGAFFLLAHRAPAAGKPIAPGGNAFFVNSGQLNEGNNQGIEDQLRVVLRNIPSPAPGKNYYAWLLSDVTQKTMTALLLGGVSVHSGNIDFSYSDPQQRNLLASYSRFLITEDRTAVTPSGDHTTWRYYDEFSTQPEPADPTRSALLHLHNLLCDGKYLLQHFGIHGGLDIQLLRNTQKILEWAGSARDAWGDQSVGAAGFIHRQSVRILDYLDGATPYNGKPLVAQDLPNEPILVSLKLTQVPLIDILKDQASIGESVQSYLDRIDTQLTRLSRAPGIPPEMSNNALQADRALIQLRAWLMKVHDDALQLARMNNQQALQPGAELILDDMQVNANKAFIGQLDPSTGTVKPGAIQIHYKIQQLATFTIHPYTSH